MNGDGKSDLIIATAPSLPNFASGPILVLIGNGDGTFQTPIVNFPTFNSTSIGEVGAIAAGDFNGDGKADIAVFTGGLVWILLGHGSGNFSPSTSYPVGIYIPYPFGEIRVADLRNNGKLDLIVLPSGMNISYSGDDSTFYAQYGQVEIMLGNGDGTFASPVIIPAPASASSFAIGDFNQDGVADIATYTSPGQIQILLGKGNGTFQQGSLYFEPRNLGRHRRRSKFPRGFRRKRRLRGKRRNRLRRSLWRRAPPPLRAAREGRANAVGRRNGACR